MKTPVKQLLFWTPRALGILSVVFISFFALDVFVEGLGFWKTAAALLLHLIPAGSVAVALAIAWRKEGAGGLLFVALGVCYLMWSRGHIAWSVSLTIAGPLFLVGTFFLLDWLCRPREGQAPCFRR